MKKSVLALILLAAVTLSSCGFYTCATYAKKPVKEADVKENCI
jgi:hypothetical protein